MGGKDDSLSSSGSCSEEKMEALSIKSQPKVNSTDIEFDQKDPYMRFCKFFEVSTFSTLGAYFPIS